MLIQPTYHEHVDPQCRKDILFMNTGRMIILCKGTEIWQHVYWII